MALFLIICLLSKVESLKIQLIYSENTPQAQGPNLLNNLLSTSHTILITEASNLKDTEPSQSLSVDIAIDLTSSLLYKNDLLTYCQAFQIILLETNCNNFIQAKWKFCMHTNPRDYIEALVLLINKLGWKRTALISENNQKYLALVLLFHDSPIVAKHFMLSGNGLARVFHTFVSKELKLKGYQQIIIVGSGMFVDSIVTSMKECSIYTKSGVIIIGDWVLERNSEKAIVLVESGLESVDSDEGYDIKAILTFLDYVSTIFQEDNSNYKEAVHENIERYYKNHMKPAEFSILNIINSEKTLIGSCNNSILVLQNISFPSGNPDSNLPAIPVSMSFSNPGGFPSATISPTLQQGAIYAQYFSKVSLSKLENHDLQIFYASCGSDFFIQSLNSYCWSQNYQKLGYFYLASPINDVAKGELDVFQAMNKSVVTIGGMIDSWVFSNTTQYPLFTRVVATENSYDYFIHLFNILNWQQFNIIYTNKTTNKAMHDNMILGGMKFTNNYNKRVLPVGYNSSMFEEFKYVFEEVDKTKLRPLFIVADFPDIFYIAESLYDIGLRSGDVIGLFLKMIASSMNQLPEGSQLRLKVLEILRNAMVASGLEWVGPYGESLKEEISQFFGSPADYKCYSFDAMMLGINGIDYLLQTDGNYEDPLVLNKAIRMQRFEGCSGIVSISNINNNRKILSLGGYQATFNNKTKLYEDLLTCIISIDSMMLVTFKRPLYFTGFSQTPSESRLEGLSCPFEARTVKSNQKSIMLFYLILGFFLVYTATFSVISWKKLPTYEIQDLSKPVQIKFSDYIVMVGIAVDMLQIIGIGPDLDPYLFQIGMIPDAISVKISNFNKFSGSFYWMCLYICIGITGFWIFLAVVILLRLEERLKFIIFTYANHISTAYIPLGGDTFFLPIVGIFLFIFDCNQGISDSITDSFLDKDCNTFCWKGFHLKLAIISFSILIVYLPLAIFLRPIWQEIQTEINLKTYTGYLNIKCVFQVALIILNKTVKKFNQSFHGCLIILGIIFFAVFLYKNKAYNYARLNMWKQTSLIMAIWAVAVGSLYWLIQLYEYIFTILFFGGWAGLILLGLVVQKRKYPSLLFEVKGFDIAVLIKFSFSKSHKAERILSMIIQNESSKGLEYMVESDGEIEDQTAFRKMPERLHAEESAWQIYSATKNFG